MAAYPQNLESQYGLAIAYTQKRQWQKAMKHVKLAVEGGLHLERFIVGPRKLLSPLTQRKEFNDQTKRGKTTGYSK